MSQVVAVTWSLFFVFFLAEKDVKGGDTASTDNSTETNDPADEPDKDSDKDSTVYVEWDADDPFKVLGLSGGIKDNTIEDVTKAKRKLALKFHPGMSFFRFMSA